MKKNLQKGSAHLVIIIVLILALVGAWGVVFWQNFMQPRASDNNLIVSNDSIDNTSGKVASDMTDVDSATEADSANVGYLVLNDWGVKFKLPEDLGDDEIIYEKATDMGESSEKYYISTKHLSLLGSECAKAYGLIRGKEAPFAALGSPISIRKIGDYYYSYYAPQTSCLDNREKGIDTEQHVSNILPLMFGSIESK